MLQALRRTPNPDVVPRPPAPRGSVREPRAICVDRRTYSSQSATVLGSPRRPPRGGLDILSIGTGEILIIITLALILFGPQRMVEISRLLGKTTRDVRRAIADVREEIEEAARTESSKHEDR